MSEVCFLTYPMRALLKDINPSEMTDSLVTKLTRLGATTGVVAVISITYLIRYD